jgi:hypothetical protein
MDVKLQFSHIRGKQGLRLLRVSENTYRRYFDLRGRK